MPREPRITHVAFSDESHWNIGRYRALALVSMPQYSIPTLEQQVRRILQNSNILEFKWNKLGGAKERTAAIDICKAVVDAACDGNLRIDVLLWDIEDSRHRIPRRDDVANLQRMYYHLFKHVLRCRWPDGSVWALYPDEQTAIDWTIVRDYLARVDTELRVHRDLFTDGAFVLRLVKEFEIREIAPVRSIVSPMSQVADLFSGMAVFSRAHYEDLEKWRRQLGNQLVLFDDTERNDMSRSIRERSYVVHVFDKLCKSKSLGVSLKTRKGLWTGDPRNPLNFWWYTPQHPLDKAPTRNTKEE